MSTICPEGHTTTDPAFCDVCGIEIGAAVAASVGAVGTEVPCGSCGEANPAGSVFCEVCGYDFATGTLPGQNAPASADTGFVVTVTHDAARAVQSTDSGLTPPDPAPDPLRVAAAGTAVLGRSSDVDISFGSGSHGDPGVSGRHLELTCDAHGVITATDLGSTNGSRVVGASMDLPPNQPVPLDPDAVILIGAWTRVEARADQAAGSSGEPTTPGAGPAAVEGAGPAEVAGQSQPDPGD